MPPKWLCSVKNTACDFATYELVTPHGLQREHILFFENVFTREVWLNYYSIADAKKFIQEMNERIGRKIRAYIWKQWKRVKCRAENLQRLGIPRSKAWEWANTRLGIWRIAGSWVMTRSVSD